MKSNRDRLVAGMVLVLMAVALGGCPGSVRDSWSWEQNGGVLEIAYGNRVTGWPQMAALHLNTSALRMVYGPDSGWGPTVYLAPSLWTTDGSAETYHLGAPVAVGVQRDGDDLLVTTQGTIASLGFANTVRFAPPVNNTFSAEVATTTSGTAVLPDRPSEAFQPVHVATMRISESQWDSQAVEVNGQSCALPLDGWVLDPPGVIGGGFTLIGGTSEWKPNAPTVTIGLDREMTLQGWAIPSNDPNDDNIGFWCATDTVLASWDYTIVAAIQQDEQ